MYKIKKGRHYSNFIPSFICLSDLKVISRDFKFTESCKYEIEEKSCVNKLFGFCFGFGVHKNSARFGWTYNKETNKIDIWCYFYNDGKLTKKSVFESDINKSHTYEFMINKYDKNKYKVFFIIDSQVKQNITFESKIPLITTLGPYFGGNTRAPHDIEII